MRCGRLLPCEYSFDLLEKGIGGFGGTLLIQKPAIQLREQELLWAIFFILKPHILHNRLDDISLGQSHDPPRYSLGGIGVSASWYLPHRRAPNGIMLNLAKSKSFLNYNMIVDMVWIYQEFSVLNSCPK